MPVISNTSGFFFLSPIRGGQTIINGLATPNRIFGKGFYTQKWWKKSGIFKFFFIVLQSWRGV
jgi:hypothetical protein